MKNAWRLILGIFVGLILWLALWLGSVEFIDVGPRSNWRDPNMLTTPYLLAKIFCNLISSFIVGIIVVAISNWDLKASYILGFILSVFLLIMQIGIRDSIPFWGHILFQVSLFPFILLGAKFAIAKRRVRFL